MENVIGDEDVVSRNAQLFFVGVGDGGIQLLQMLDEECKASFPDRFSGVDNLARA
jgi:hypothetical protein